MKGGFGPKYSQSQSYNRRMASMTARNVHAKKRKGCTGEQGLVSLVLSSSSNESISPRVCKAPQAACKLRGVQARAQSKGPGFRAESPTNLRRPNPSPIPEIVALPRLLIDKTPIICISCPERPTPGIVKRMQRGLGDPGSTSIQGSLRQAAVNDENNVLARAPFGKTPGPQPSARRALGNLTNQKPALSVRSYPLFFRLFGWILA